MSNRYCQEIVTKRHCAILRTLVIVAMSFSLLCCIGEEPPKCDSEEAINVAKDVIANKILKGHVFCLPLVGCAALQDEIETSVVKSYLTFQYPRAISYDDRIKKYDCTADIFLGGRQLFKEQLNYESQLTSDGALVYLNAPAVYDGTVYLFLQSLPDRPEYQQMVEAEDGI